MDKRIMTELLLVARACDMKNQSKVVLCMMDMFDILDSMVAIHAQKRESCLTIVEAEANLIWMRTHWLLRNEGLRFGSLNSYAYHMDKTSYNTERNSMPPIYLTNVN